MYNGVGSKNERRNSLRGYEIPLGRKRWWLWWGEGIGSEVERNGLSPSWDVSDLWRPSFLPLSVHQSSYWTTDWILQVFVEWIHAKKFYTNLKNKVQFNISYKGRIQKVVATEQKVQSRHRKNTITYWDYPFLIIMPYCLENTDWSSDSLHQALEFWEER